MVDLRQQVKTLELRLALLERTALPQLPTTPPPDARADDPDIFQLRNRVENLEKRLTALEKQDRKARGAAQELPRIGHITIIGCTKLTGVIRREMQLYPGQILDDKALQIAETSLAPFDHTLHIADTDSPGFKDIVVQVKEK
jgi:hypothetical protein